MKKTTIVLILTISFLVIAGCGDPKDVNQANIKSISTKTNSTEAVKVTPISTPKIKNTSTPIPNNNDFLKVLPVGKFKAITIKRTYKYPNSKVEKQEKILENKFRKCIENSGYDIVGKSFYNKDIAFRNNVISPLKQPVSYSDSFKNYISNDEFLTLIQLYNSAQESFVKDKTIDLEIKKNNNIITIISSPKSTKYLDNITIDNLNNKTIIGKETLNRIEEVYSDGYETAILGIDNTRIKINNEELELVSSWSKIGGTNYQKMFTVSKLTESKKPVIRYVFYDFTKNEFTEDMILINR
ncbi:MAG: hypothetical protein Q8942_12055 [Bacillota bacterium]|nr:hypothetical protein [Bacillota bacterium]